MAHFNKEDEGFVLELGSEFIALALWLWKPYSTYHKDLFYSCDFNKALASPLLKSGSRWPLLCLLTELRSSFGDPLFGYDSMYSVKGFIFTPSILTFHPSFEEQDKLHEAASEAYAMAWMAQKFASLPLACISKVPRVLRIENEEAYTPQVVSIGPYHHGIERVKDMEEHKIRYQSDFLRRRPDLSRDCFRRNLEKVEKYARGCYEDPIMCDSDEFVEIMLLDGCFILELLLKWWEPPAADVMFRRQSMLPTVTFDMILLENQLPYFVLELIFVLYRGPELHPREPSLDQIVLNLLNFEKDLGIARSTLRVRADGTHWSHFLDLLRDCCLPSGEDSWAERDMVSDRKSIPSASQLSDSGATFSRLSGNLFSLKFRPSGVFEIPVLAIHSSTGLLFRNLLAFEQGFQDAREQYITHYLHLMDSLISSPKDVATLRRCGIMENWVGDDERVSRMFNNITKGAFINTKIGFYEAARRDVKKYYTRPWNSFKAMLLREYFYSPWAGASSGAVILVVICTIIQTVCALISLRR